MTPEQYWDGKPGLARDYRKAEHIRREQKNTELWLQGAYVYQAIVRVAPILQAFAKKGTKPQPYLEEPFSLTKEQEDKVQETREKKAYENGKRRMDAMMANINKRFKKE